jgi:hypothetical protein
VCVCVCAASFTCGERERETYRAHVLRISYQLYAAFVTVGKYSTVTCRMWKLALDASDTEL